MKWSIDECSSILISKTVESLKCHFTTSVSWLVPFTCVALATFVHHLLKSCSLIKCQTEESGALMTADSVTEVEVGMREDIL